MIDQTLDCVIPSSAKIAESVKLGPRVVLAGDGVVLCSNTRIDAAAVIGADVTIGQGAWVRAGAVVLRSVLPNAIVEGNPAQVVGYLDSGGIWRKPDSKHVDIHAFSQLPRRGRDGGPR